MHLWIANRFGVVRDALVADVASVSWILNDIGRLVFTLSQRDAKARPETLAFGNRVLLQWGNGLPAWAGVILPPRRWSVSAAEVQVTAYTIEQMLKFRLTDRGRYFRDATVGAIFTAIVQEAQSPEPLNIIVRNVWHGGGTHSPAYHYKSAWWILSESIRRMEACDVQFTPALEGGRIVWYADLQNRVGRDQSTAVSLTQGYNVVGNTIVEEQGTIVNEVAAIGVGTTWGPDRASITARDEDSITTYGLFQDVIQPPGVSEVATLESYARLHVQTYAQPRLRFQIEVADTLPGRFRDYNVGDTVTLDLPTARWGYRGRVRVLAREYRPASGVCGLVVEEEPDTTRRITIRS